MSRFFNLCLFLVALAANSAANAADAFPSKPIRLIVNVAPGEQLDTNARRVAVLMGKTLGQAVVVENRTGAEGLIGIRFVKNAPADGYTLLATSVTIAQLPAVKAAPGYDLEKDFIGIGPLIRSPLVMVSATSHPDKTLAELIARAKANPNKLTFASGGEGTTTHAAAIMLLQGAGIRMVHVPYRGTGAAMADVLGGRVNMVFLSPSAASPQIRAKRLRPYAVTSAKRMSILPDVPTIAEQVIPGYDYWTSLGIVAPSGTPKPVVKRLSEALRIALEDKTLRNFLSTEGSETFYMPPEDYTAFLAQEASRFAKLATDLKLAKH